MKVFRPDRRIGFWAMDFGEVDFECLGNMYDKEPGGGHLGST
jgi:hypothetical protein